MTFLCFYCCVVLWVFILGMTLLSIACSSDPEDGLIEQIQFLIKDKGADCKLVDVEGKTAVSHCYCPLFEI